MLSSLPSYTAEFQKDLHQTNRIILQNELNSKTKIQEIAESYRNAVSHSDLSDVKTVKSILVLFVGGVCLGIIFLSGIYFGYNIGRKK